MSLQEGQAVKTIKARAYTSKAGHAELDRVMGLACQLYNAALQERRDAYKMAGVSISKAAQAREFTGVRSDLLEYAAVNRRLMLDSTINRVDLAFQGFFRRVKAGQTPGFPRFKSRRRFNTLSANYVEKSWYKPQPNGKLAIKINGLPKLEIAHYAKLPEDLPLSIRITKRGRKLWVAMAYAFTPEKLPHTGQAVGIDRGVVKLLADSNGYIEPPFKANRNARKRLQQKQSKCRGGKRGEKHSRRRRKYQDRINALLDRERNGRLTRLHQLTATYVRDNDVIAIEDLRILNMVKSAKGTAESPGRGVKAKSGLNREILAQNWGEFARLLTYKAEWAGRKVVKVNPAYTSQACNECGVIERRNRQGQFYTCNACGVEMDADCNAALNIRRLGLANLNGVESNPDGPPDIISRARGPS